MALELMTTARCTVTGPAQGRLIDVPKRAKPFPCAMRGHNPRATDTQTRRCRESRDPVQNWQ